MVGHRILSSEPDKKTPLGILEQVRGNRTLFSFKVPFTILSFSLNIYIFVTHCFRQFTYIPQVQNHLSSSKDRILFFVYFSRTRKANIKPAKSHNNKKKINKSKEQKKKTSSHCVPKTHKLKNKKKPRKKFTKSLKLWQHTHTIV